MAVNSSTPPDPDPRPPPAGSAGKVEVASVPEPGQTIWSVSSLVSILVSGPPSAKLGKVESLSNPPLGEEERLLEEPPQGRELPISLPMVVLPPPARTLW